MSLKSRQLSRTNKEQNCIEVKFQQRNEKKITMVDIELHLELQEYITWELSDAVLKKKWRKKNWLMQKCIANL